MNDPACSNQAVMAARRRLWLWLAVLVLMTTVSAAWTFTPIGELIDPQALILLLDGFGDHPLAPWIVLAGFLIGGLLVLPVTLMVVVTALSFGPIEAFLYALAGATLTATLGFVIGRLLGHRYVERLAGSRLHHASTWLGDAGVTAIAAARMLPVTHFMVVSLVAGASHIRFRDFVAGTVVGMAPGVAAIAIFLDRLSAVTLEPSAQHILWLTVVSLAILAVLLIIRHVVRERMPGRNEADMDTPSNASIRRCRTSFRA